MQNRRYPGLLAFLILIGMFRGIINLPSFEVLMMSTRFVLVLILLSKKRWSYRLQVYCHNQAITQITWFSKYHGRRSDTFIDMLPCRYLLKYSLTHHTALSINSGVRTALAWRIMRRGIEMIGVYRQLNCRRWSATLSAEPSILPSITNYGNRIV